MSLSSIIAVINVDTFTIQFSLLEKTSPDILKTRSLHTRGKKNVF
jgi:hypothetical protein